MREIILVAQINLSVYNYLIISVYKRFSVIEECVRSVVFLYFG